jgi:hypothetical protein
MQVRFNEYLRTVKKAPVNLERTLALASRLFQD